MIKVYASSLYRDCEACGKRFQPAGKHHRFCGVDCQRRKSIKTTGSGLDLPRSTIGAMNELIVSSFLLGQGFYVFRSLSSNSPFDIYAFKGERRFRIEIRSGLGYKEKIYFSSRKSDNCDLYAVVFHGEVSFYDSKKKPFIL